MLLKIRHGLLEISNQPKTRKSAIIINNEFVITSGSILRPYVDSSLHQRGQYTQEEQASNTNDKIIKKLQGGQLISLLNDEETVESQYLNSLSYQVMYDQRRRNVVLEQEGQTQFKPIVLSRHSAKALYLFSLPDVSRYLHTFLDAATDTTTGDGTEHNNHILISSFLLLSIRFNKEQASLNSFLTHVSQYLRFVHPIHNLDDVLSICTPFGLENFYKTISIGKVSKVMGRDGCLFVLSNALPLGCEGSAVFNNKLRLIGIIICTSFTIQFENVNLSLAGSFTHMLRELMRQLGHQINSIQVPRESSHFAWENAMVVIEAAGSQGTGTFIKVQNKKFILTCSHVIYQVTKKVFCRSVDGEFQSEVVWHNPHYNRPFDLALLSVPKTIPEKYFVRLSTTKPHPGQTVYNAGFPYFVNFNLKYDFNPAIFQGRIIKCAPGAIMSDGCVQAGQSGGPMFDERGRVLGVCVSNMKLDNDVYPYINTAVPVHEIRQTLQNYAKTNDLNVLNNLVANKEIQKFWSLETDHILSKL